MNRADDFDYDIDDLLIMSEAKNYQKWIMENVADYIGSNILEVGAGIGNYTKFFIDRKKIHVIELSPSCFKMLKSKFYGKGNIDFYQIDITDEIILQFKQKEIDTIVCLNVLEHIENDTLALQYFYEILSTGGHLILQIPALTMLYGRLDEQLGHFRRYNKKLIKERVQRTKFKIEKNYYLNLLGALGWFYMAKIKKQANQNRRQVLFFDRVIVPIIASIERCIKIPFGQSLIVILKK